MNEEQKRDYLERYKRAKEEGEPFFPDVIFKDALVGLLVLVLLVGLSYFVGAPLEEQADPADTTYTPRPEWYFLFLFQLLKYFPGELEVIGVFVIPTIVLAVLFVLPFLDRTRFRHPLDRPWVTGVTTVLVIGIALLTYLSVREAPPPAEASGGDPIAALYVANCAPCHGSAVQVPPGTNLHEVIAQGGHREGMPAWSADLTSDEIDALAGFIASPGGSRLFTEYCAACHEGPELVAGDPIELRLALDLAADYPRHRGLDVPNWNEMLTQQQRTDLLNFLVAPDGQRLFAINCSSCHGSSVAFQGGEQELRQTIEEGGRHLSMPAWRGRLETAQLELLANYVVDPLENPGGEALFRDNCSTCHGVLVPRADTVDDARSIILFGGSHEIMPVWGSVLTDQQLDALVSYTLDAARGTTTQVGQLLFSENCAICHGEFGEGGVNPTRAGDVIAPISTAEYLRTRDDTTLRAIIARGQPNFGMSPFSSAFGGPLDEDEVDAIVAFIRSWEANPPVDLPPEINVAAVALSGDDIFDDLCAQCHGLDGAGTIGPSLIDASFQSSNTDQQIFQAINLGHGASAMIGWGEILTAEQIDQLVGHIRRLARLSTPQPAGGPPSFAADILPIFQRQCAACHGALGGWDGSTYESVMNTGNNAPVILPGDPDNSLLAQKLLNTQEIGGMMPVSGPLSYADIQLILDWITAGAEDN